MLSSTIMAIELIFSKPNQRDLLLWSTSIGGNGIIPRSANMTGDRLTSTIVQSFCGAI